MTSIRVVYDGAALREHRMDVRDLAPALLAIERLLDVATKALNGPDTRMQVQVIGSFKTGSFGIDFSVGTLLQQALELVGMAKQVDAQHILDMLGLAAKTGGAVVGAYKGVVGLIRWVRSRRINKVELLENDRVRITVDEDSFETEERVLHLYRNWQLRKALEDMLAPLSKEGIDSFATTQDDGKSFEVVVKKEEVHWFATPQAPDEALSDFVSEKTLQLVAIAFKDDNKWRFSDGANTFYATVTDKGFLRDVDGNLAFSKGDVLRVKLRTMQAMRGPDLHSEYEVVEVIEHRRAGMTQIPLPIEQNDRSKT